MQQLALDARPGPLAGAVAAFAIFAGALRSASGQDLDQATDVLSPASPIVAELDLESQSLVVYRVEVPDGTMSWTTRLACRRTDLDLHIGRGPAPDEFSVYEEALISSVEEGFVDRVTVDRLSEPLIASGEWWVAVECPWPDYVPEQDEAGAQIEQPYRIPFRLETELFGARTDGQLAPGIAAASATGRATGGFRTFELDVPQDAGALRLDLYGCRYDLDLYARRRRTMRSRPDALVAAEANWGPETLRIGGDEPARLRPGKWFIDVLDPWQLEHEVPFELLATFDHDPPARLLAYPEPPRPRGTGALAPALTGVVEIFGGGGGGSGSLLTRDGLVLTNAHVVSGSDEQPLEELVIALVDDPRLPARPLFRAEVVEFDMPRDLALLRPMTGFYGQPLPADWEFPTIPLGDPETVSLGDPLWIVGFPALGADGGSVSLNVTHGVCSGFERIASGATFKTDAGIYSGNSGGAALNAAGELIGLPTAAYADELGSVGIVHPLWLLPEAWWGRHGIARPAAPEQR